MRELLVQPAVIGEQQQAGGVLVEPAHRKDPLRDVHQLKNDALARVPAARQ